MQQILLIISVVLIMTTIIQFMQVSRLKKQTIEAFQKLCEKVFEDTKNDIR